MTSEFERPLLTVDTVILTLIDARLHVLLVRRNKAPQKGVWTLPGGFVHTDEDKTAEDAARRVLIDKAGVGVRHLEQLATFASATRDARGWSASIVYLALVESTVQEPREDARFVPVDEVGVLPFDHSDILEVALRRVRDKSSYSSLPAFLLPVTFTLPELQRVYEQVLGTSLNAAAFRRKVLDQELVEPVSDRAVDADTKRSGPGRSAQRYQLTQQRLQDMGRVVMLPDRRRGG